MNFLITTTNNSSWLNQLDWKSISTYGVPILTVMLTYLFGWLSGSISQKRAIRTERYKSLYLPAISVMLERRYWAVVPHILHTSIVRDFYPIITSNLGLLDGKSAILFSDFMMPCFTYKVDLGLKIDAGKNHESPYIIPQKDIDLYDETFTAFELSLLQEASRLSKKLKYPDISATILENCVEQTHANQ